jgi:hypothetical protein
MSEIYANQYVFSPNTDLSPVMCEDGINYRVPVQIATERKNTYVVHIGNMSIRVFTPETLPDFVRVRVSMIKASGRNETLTMKIDDNLTTLDLFRTRRGNLEDIGWQASETMCIVVMSAKELSTLKGMI